MLTQFEHVLKSDLAGSTRRREKPPRGRLVLGCGGGSGGFCFRQRWLLGVRCPVRAIPRPVAVVRPADPCRLTKPGAIPKRPPDDSTIVLVPLGEWTGVPLTPRRILTTSGLGVCGWGAGAAVPFGDGLGVPCTDIRVFAPDFSCRRAALSAPCESPSVGAPVMEPTRALPASPTTPQPLVALRSGRHGGGGSTSYHCPW